MKKITVACFVLIVNFAQAQFLYRLDTSVPVIGSDGPLSSAWSGGLNAAQYNTMDIDLDGQEDLIVYDRTASKIFAFLRQGNTYVHAPQFETLFPPELTNWVLLRDYDGDGRKDLFTGHIFGIRVFRNISTEHDVIWEPFIFNTGASQSEVLITKGLSGMINLQLQFDDLPSITDADGDGDLDIFAMDFGGTGRVEFHRNFSVERHGNRNQLEFELITKSWGGFAECDCAEFAFGNEACGSSGGRVKHQGGKSLLALDANGDGTLDMLLSEAECDKLNLLPNQGSLDNPEINSSELFPALPATFPLYPTAYTEDVDFDGQKDLLVSPNLFSRIDGQAIDFRKSNWFYRNTGTNAAPVFEFQQTDFLQATMIDVGDNAVPAFADLDGDGDLDLFVSTNQFPAAITVFENTGTRNSPAFTLLTNDYLNLSVSGFRNLKIQFIDVNRDQTRDLVFTATLNGSGKLYYVANASATRLDFAGAQVQETSVSFSSQENLHLTDVNDDGNPDILRGRNTGALEYWRNTGGLSFTLEDGQFLGMAVNPLTINPVVSAADLNGDGKTDLMIADHTGQIRVVPDFRNSGTASGALKDIVFNPLTETYYAPNLGGRVWPVAVDLFNAGRPVIILGTGTGGLRLLKPEDGNVDVVSVLVFPNPFARQLDEYINIVVNQPANLEIYAITGQLVQSLPSMSPGSHSWDGQVLASGLYLFRFSVGNKTVTKRVVIQ